MKTEESTKVRSGQGLDGFERYAAQFGELAGGLNDEGRLIALPAFGHRREIGRVGLDQYPIGGRAARGFLNFERFWKRENPAEAQVEAEIERANGFTMSSGETVHDAAESVFR